MSSGVVALVADAPDVASAPAGARCVPLSPSALLACERAGRAVTLLSDVVSDESIETRGDENLARVPGLAAALDAASARAGLEGAPGTWHVWELKCLLDAVGVRSLEIDAALRATGAQALWLSGKTFYAPVARTLAQRRSVALLDAGPESATPIEVPGAAPGSDRVAWLRARLSAVRAAGRRANLGTRALALDYAYSLPFIATALERQGAEVWFWHGGRVSYRHAGVRIRRHDTAGASRASVEVPVPHGELASMFTWPEGELLEAAWECGLRHILEQGIPGAVAHYLDTGIVVRDHEPSVALVSSAAVATMKAAAEACRAAGLPVAVARHGELGMRDIPAVALEDLPIADAVLSWGEWEQRWTLARARPAFGAPVVGSPMVHAATSKAPHRRRARAMAGIDPGQRVLLYVPTGHSEDRWYASHRQPRDVPHFAHQRAVVQTLLDADPSALVAVKLHPNDPDPALSDWVAHLGPRVRSITQPSFTQLINAPDVAVLDFASTSLVQALFAAAPCACVVDHPLLRWEPGVIEHLSRHGIPVVPVDGLAAALASMRPVRDRIAARRPLAAPDQDPAMAAADAVLHAARDTRGLV